MQSHGCIHPQVRLDTSCSHESTGRVRVSVGVSVNESEGGTPKQVRLDAAPGHVALTFAGALSLPITAGEALSLEGEASVHLESRKGESDCYRYSAPVSFD